MAAGAAGGGPGKAGKAARAEAEAGAGLRGEAGAGGRAAASADRPPKGPYINNNPRATVNEKAVGALLQRELKEEVTGEPEQKGEPSPDYRFHHADGRIERADLYSPTTGDKASLAATIMKKGRQASTIVIEFGHGGNAMYDVAEARQIAESVKSTPGHLVTRLIFIKEGRIIYDVPV